MYIFPILYALPKSVPKSETLQSTVTFNAMFYSINPDPPQPNQTKKSKAVRTLAVAALPERKIKRRETQKKRPPPGNVFGSDPVGVRGRQRWWTPTDF